MSSRDERASTTLILAVCLSLTACTSQQADAPQSGTSIKSSTSVAQPSQPDSDFSQYLADAKASGVEPTVYGLISEAFDAPSIRRQVKEKCGGLRSQQFCQYFASPQFAEIARRLIGKSVVITYEPDSAQIYDKTYPPNSVLLYTDGPEIGDHFNCDELSAAGKKDMGGGGVTISKEENEP